MRTIYKISEAEAKRLIAVVHAANIQYLDEFKTYLPKTDVKSPASQTAYLAGIKYAARINEGHLGPSDLPNKHAAKPFLAKLIARKKHVPNSNEKNLISHLNKYGEMVEENYQGLFPKEPAILAMNSHVDNGDGSGQDHENVDTSKQDYEVLKAVEQASSANEIEKALAKLESKLSSAPPARRIRLAYAIARNQKLAGLVKRKAGYKCQKCGLPGFEKKDGGLYAEAHHQCELSQNGSDTVHNLVCLCANCHRKAHYAK